ncbi:MAG TPA: SPOR domain-containing protein [Pyrinomonadaceae bacterium]|nr:SPOR domain-containing protein [Pyrinomonadaceae bacterium]
MQVTCPVCQLKGLYDAEPDVTESRVVCARCSAEYEVVIVDGQIVTALETAPAPVAVEVMPQFARPLAVAPAPSDEPVLEDVFAVEPEVESDFFAPHSPILEDVFAPLSVAPESKDDSSDARVETPISEEASATTADAATDAREAQAEAVPAPKTSPAARFDGYSAGARVMQASPLWLLVCGLAFIACIVLFNRITTEAGEEVAGASAQPVARNDATNQSAASSFMPDVEIKSEPADAFAPAPVHEEAAKETAQASAPVAAEEVPAEAVKESAAPAVEERPVVAESVREEVAVAAPSASSSGGKFTVQVGAHNVSEKAEAQAAQMKSAGFEARVVAAEVPKRGTWYRVQAGRFETREEATRHGAEMRAKGVAQSVVVAEVQ